MSIDPANKKARLRRGLALEKLGLDAVAAADMVLLLAEDKAIPQVQERSRGGRLHPAPTSRHTTSPRKWTKSRVVISRFSPGKPFKPDATRL
jgi:hypothetical protein